MELGCDGWHFRPRGIPSAQRSTRQMSGTRYVSVAWMKGRAKEIASPLLPGLPVGAGTEIGSWGAGWQYWGPTLLTAHGRHPGPPRM